MQITAAELIQILGHFFPVAEKLTGIQTSIINIGKELHMATLTLADVQAKITTINDNTTAAATAAQAVADQLAALRTQVASMGLSADQEATIFAALDGPITTSGALKTFLEATAAGPTEPTPPAPPAPPAG